MPVTESRESGVELLDTEVEEASEDADFVHFQTDEEVEIEVGESAGNPVYVQTRYFVAASIDTEADEITQQMTGQERINESSVFISNEDGEIGGGFVKVEEGDLDDAIEQFEDEKL